jgi:sugar phosphate permease
MSFLMRDPRSMGAVGSAGSEKTPRGPKLTEYLGLARIKSYVLATAGMAALTFAIGGISFWMPHYLIEARGLPASSNLWFGVILCVAGFFATMSGGLVGDWLKKYWRGSYFLISGLGILCACPFVLMMLHAPFPLAWVWIFCAVFFLFFNTGPANTILANVTRPSIRASAFALNIFIIHALGDAPSPPLLGRIAGRFGWNVAFELVVAVMVFAAVLWLLGVRYLPADTARAEDARADAAASPDAAPSAG